MPALPKIMLEDNGSPSKLPMDGPDVMVLRQARSTCESKGMIAIGTWQVRLNHDFEER